MVSKKLHCNPIPSLWLVLCNESIIQHQVRPGIDIITGSPEKFKSSWYRPSNIHALVTGTYMGSNLKKSIGVSAHAESGEALCSELDAQPGEVLRDETAECSISGRARCNLVFGCSARSSVFSCSQLCSRTDGEKLAPCFSASQCASPCFAKKGNSFVSLDRSFVDSSA